jgi:prepilin-type N-terminal cleavage/methylation domain-containing protein
MKPARICKGFTLIELLIVISLVTIITGAVIPSFNTYVDNQNVKQAQETVIDDLRTIQNKALNGELAREELPGVGGTKVEFWGIRFLQDTPRYEHFISVNDTECVGAAADVLSVIVTSKPLPGGSVTRAANNCIWVSFENGDISWLTNDTITVGPNVADVNVCRRVVVTANGLIHAEAGDGC